MSFERENVVTERIISAAIAVHRNLGPGLLESACEESLGSEMARCGPGFVRQPAIPVVYREVKLECGYRPDFIVERLVVLEVKALEAVHPVHEAQLLTYVKLGPCRVGLLVNFNVAVLREGILRRVV